MGTFRSLATQYKLLMWKNLMLLKRSPFRVFIEIFWPLALFLILMAVRSRDTLLNKKPECHFHNKPMPSAGILPFFQGMVCTSNNTCMQREVTDELSSQLTSFDTSPLELLVKDMAGFLSNETQREVLLHTVKEIQKVTAAVDKARRMDEPLITLLGINEEEFYNDLQQQGFPLNASIVDLLLSNTTVNSSALLDELIRIGNRDPEFIPLLETFVYDLLDIQNLLQKDSSLWSQALADDFTSSLNDLPNLNLTADDIAQRIGNIDVSGIDFNNLLSQVRRAQSADEITQIISNATQSSGVDEQMINILELSTEQQKILADFCVKEENQNSSACLLAQLLTRNATNRLEVLNNLCSQPRYDNLTTCLIWDFTTVRSVVDASQVANSLCTHHIITNSSLCDMVEIQNRLLKILNDDIDPAEVLCNDNTTIIEYPNDAIRSTLHPSLCNLSRNDSEVLLRTMAEHINITAVRELYFPDGFNFTVVYQLAVNLQELANLQTVQDMLSVIRNISAEGITQSLCGGSSDDPLGMALAASREAASPEDSANSTQPDGSTTTLSPTAQEDQDREYQYHNSSQWNRTRYCKHLFWETIGRGDYGRLIMNQLYPILFGKIPYYPATDKINETIQGANRTFETLAQMANVANIIRGQYNNWLAYVNRYGDDLFFLDRILQLLDSGNRTGISGVVSQQQFLDELIQTMSRSGVPLPFDADDIPRNLTAIVIQLRELSRSLERGGDIWNAIDAIGKASTQVYQYLDCVELDKFEPHESKESLEKSSIELIKQNRYWAAIVFNDTSKGIMNNGLPSHVTYQIRMNTDKVDDTARIEDKYWQPGPRSNPPWDTKYITYGFAYIQDMIEHSLINIMTGDDDSVGIYLQQFPYPCYTVDWFVRGISRSFPLFMVLSWIFSVALLVKSIVYEKQERLKEQMKIMGLTNGIQWVAWYTTGFILIAPSIFFLCLIFKYGKVLQAADPSVLALLLFAFSFATTGQAFLFSVFFTRANLAACCGAIFYFALYLPYAVVYQYEEMMTDWMKSLASLISPVAFGIGATYVSRYEEQGIGIHWNNITKSPLPDDTFNLAKCIVFLFVDGCLYWLLAWYLEYIFPGKYGVRKPFYFPFTRSFWLGTSTPSKSSGNLELNARSGSYNVRGASGGTPNPAANVNYETEPKHLPLGVEIKELTKIYKTGKKLAVDGLSLNLYENQITSFLGHNGAGKTTTMSVLCGLFPPSHGTAMVYGKDIRHDLDEIRKSLGFCPQFNVLYDTLTVSEHILFYGQLKGLSYKEANEEMNSMLQATGMEVKRDALTKSLSGGMKRKLSVMCAFVGKSKCVILDEPTAGVDPYSRRQIWDLLLNFKHGRTILLSTHHMDEADFLGDRIAVISHGKLCCAGSSLFLKSLHGNGYYLTIVRTEGTESDSTTENAIEKFVLDRVPGSVLMESVGVEMVFQLPSSEVKTGAFVTLFTDLDSSLEKLQIASYGLSDTTLEEVFLKIAEQTGVDAEVEMTDGGNLAMPINRQSFRFRSGIRNVFNKIVKKNVAKLKAKHQKYKPQVDDTTSVMSASGSTANLSEVDADEDNAKNIERSKTSNGVSDSTDVSFSDLAESEEMGLDRGQLSISYDNTNTSTQINNLNDTQDAENKENKLTGLALLRNQVIGLIIKRFHHVKRDKMAFLCEIVLPAFFVLLAMAFALAIPPIEPKPPLELQPWMYEPSRGDAHLTAFYRNEYPESEFTQMLEKLTLEGQYGTRCMDPSVYQIPDHPCSTDHTLGASWTQEVKKSIYPECECKTTGYQQCKAPEAYPSNITINTNDHMVNMTGKIVSRWIVNTMTPFIKRRYGGFSFDVGGSPSHINESDIYTIMSAVLPTDPQDAADISDAMEDVLDMVNINENIKVWFNNKGWASSVSYMNAANNLVLRYKLLKAGRYDYKKFGITAINYPMNRTDYQLEQKILDRGYVSLLISLCVIFAMSLIPATFVLYLIMDRVSTGKSLQFVSGMNKFIYWITNLAWDIFNYTICAALCFLIFLAFNEKAYVSATNGPCLALLMFLYGWAMIPFMYPFSFVFKESSMAFVILGCLNIFLGIVSTVTTFTLETFYEDPELENINKILKQVFLILPHYCLGRGLIDMSVEHIKQEVNDLLGVESSYDPFVWDLVGKNMFALVVQGFVFFILLLLIEYKFFYTLCCKCTGAGSEEDDIMLEDDVRAEAIATQSEQRSGDALKVLHLRKEFGKPSSLKSISRNAPAKQCYGLLRKHTAVNNLSFGVPSNQCFGLLGVNGAGKTTTFRMLTGIARATAGDAKIKGKSITTDIEDVRQMIGYCPQFDAIDPLLTGREHLEYYARLRGVHPKHVKDVATKKIKKMGLIKYENKRAGDYSGGNKRKLQAAIALIGNPSVIFMDEPTTGMDPKARRFLWDSIIKITKEGHAVVLTSHSMEECEVLCHRLAIMVNGTFRCLGSPQHLKNKYGEGYHLTARITSQESSSPDISQLLVSMDSLFHTSARLLENSPVMAQYHISSDISVAEIFSKMESIRSSCMIEDYSVAQTSLDHVFIHFAKQQMEELEPDLPSSSRNMSTSDSTSYTSNGLSASSQRNLIV